MPFVRGVKGNYHPIQGIGTFFVEDFQYLNSVPPANKKLVFIVLNKKNKSLNIHIFIYITFIIKEIKTSY